MRLGPLVRLPAGVAMVIVAIVPVRGSKVVLAATRPPGHAVMCPLCGKDFELLSAPWCGCDRGHPSKICPRCERCLCQHPDYQRPSLWRDAPAALRARGFERLFVYYV